MTIPLINEMPIIDETFTMFPDKVSVLKLSKDTRNAVNDVINYINSTYGELVKMEIEARFDELMIDSTYDATTKTLILKLGDKTNG